MTPTPTSPAIPAEAVAAVLAGNPFGCIVLANGEDCPSCARRAEEALTVAHPFLTATVQGQVTVWRDRAYRAENVQWSDLVPPGGEECATCGTPVESEPCPEHAPGADATQRTVSALVSLAARLLMARDDLRSKRERSSWAAGMEEAAVMARQLAAEVQDGAIL